MRKKSAVILSAMMVISGAVQAQDDTTWDSDPLDVLEEQQNQEPSNEFAEPTVPDFQEIPEEGSFGSEQEVMPPAPAPEMVPPSQDSWANSTPSYSNDPDFNKEANFHDIYRTYNQNPTPSDAWEQAVGPRVSEAYGVQKGDTLWDISRTLFGDSFFWPKIWALNKNEILNPHEISPLMSIQFYPGNMEDVPTVQLAENTVAENQQERTVVVGGTAGVSEVVQIPPGRPRPPVLKKLPPSLPIAIPDAVNKEKTFFEVQLPKTSFPKAPEYLVYYVSDGPVRGEGIVNSTGLSGRMANEYQNVYVQFNGVPQKHYVVQKNLDWVPDPQQSSRKAQIVEAQGELEILEKVNEGKNIYRAIVTKAISPIEVGAEVVAGRLPVIDPSKTSVIDGVGGQIMGGAFEKNRKLYGTASLVFLDRGSQQGIQVGQTLRIYADEKLRNKKTDIEINSRTIGTVKIVRTSPGFSTGYVVDAQDDIMTGDIVGNANRQAAAAPAPSDWSDSAAPASSDLEQEFDSIPTESAPAPDSGSDDLDLDF